jgi:hypothetical protein
MIFKICSFDGTSGANNLTERRDSRIRSRIALSSWVKGETLVIVMDLTHENKYHTFIIGVGVPDLSLFEASPLAFNQARFAGIRCLSVSMMRP